MSNIERSEVLDYIKELAKEMAQSIKKNTKGKNEAFNSILSNLEPQREEKKKSILDLPFDNNTKNSSGAKQATQETERVISHKVNISQSNKEDSLFFNDDMGKKVKPNKDKTFYDRKVDELARKEKKLEVLRNKKRLEEKSNFTQKPKIDKTSQKLMEKKQIRPIHERVEEVMENKNLKLEKKKFEIKEKLQFESEASKLTSQPNNNYDEKKFEDWIKVNKKWEEKKKYKIENMKVENERIETEVSKSLYHPNIDKYSKILVESKVTNEPIYEKLYNKRDDKYTRVAQKIVENIPEFKPTVNKKLPKYLVKHMEGKKGKHYHSVEEEDIEKDLSQNPKRTHYDSVHASNRKPRIEEVEEEDDNDLDLISKYKSALLREENLASSNLNKKTSCGSNKQETIKNKKNGFNKSYDEELSNRLENANTRDPNPDKDNKGYLYKINVRNNSSCKPSENQLIYNPKFFGLFKGMNN